MLGDKLGCTYGELFGFKLGYADGIELFLDEGTDMGYLMCPMNYLSMESLMVQSV